VSVRPTSAPKSTMWNVSAVEVELSAAIGAVTAQNRMSRTAACRSRSPSVPITTGGAPSPGARRAAVDHEARTLRALPVQQDDDRRHDDEERDREDPPRRPESTEVDERQQQRRARREREADEGVRHRGHEPAASIEPLGDHRAGRQREQTLPGEAQETEADAHHRHGDPQVHRADEAEADEHAGEAEGGDECDHPRSVPVDRPSTRGGAGSRSCRSRSDTRSRAAERVRPVLPVNSSVKTLTPAVWPGTEAIMPIVPAMTTTQP
jgi:hypothetical protein